jgi:hypothetical protein
MSAAGPSGKVAPPSRLTSASCTAVRMGRHQPRSDVAGAGRQSHPVRVTIAVGGVAEAGAMPFHDEQPIGPVEMMLIGFPGDSFDGSILPALSELVDNGTVRLIDLVMVRKDEEGNVTAAEISELDPDAVDAFDQLDGEISELLSEDDLELAAEQLPAGSAAALVLWESSWATRLAEAVADNGGEIFLHDHIPAEVVAEVLASQPD